MIWRVLALLAALCVGPAQAQLGQIPTFIQGSGAPSGCSATFAADGGSTVAQTTGSTTGTLTTANGCGVIVVGILVSGGPTSTGISATGLTFTAFPNTQPSVLANGDKLYMWTAPYTTNFSGNITVNMSGSTYNVMSILAVSGAKTTSPQDAGGPVNSATGTISMTSLNANDVIVAMFECNNTGTAGTGWTASPGSAAGNFVFMEYQIASATGTFTASMGGGGTVQQGGTIAGIQKGP